MSVIYLKVDFKETRNAISEHISAYNAKIFETDPVRFKSQKIKYAVEMTVFAILEMYAKFLHRNEAVGVKNPVFRMNNQALVTKLKGRISKTTAWRHIKRATECGIFDKALYRFHGSKASFEMGFNPNVLVACYDQSYTLLLTQQAVNKLSASGEKHVNLISERPKFKNSFNGYMLSTCDHTVPRTEILNKNMNIVNVDKGIERIIPGPILQEHGKLGGTLVLSDVIKLYAKNEGSPELLNSKKSQEQKFRAGRDQIIQKEKDLELRVLYAKSSLRLAIRVLFAEREIPDEHKTEAGRHILKYYSPIDQTKKLSDLDSDFQLTIFEAYKAIFRKGFKPRPLYSYFNPDFDGGFYSTLNHVNTVVKQYLERNKDSQESFKQARFFYLKYLNQPDKLAIYNEAVKALNRKRSTVYLDFFNACVLNRKV